MHRLLQWCKLNFIHYDSISKSGFDKDVKCAGVAAYIACSLISAGGLTMQRVHVLFCSSLKCDSGKCLKLH